MCLQLHFLLKVCPSPFCLKIPTSFPCFLFRFLSSGRFMIPSPSLFPTAFCSNSNERVYCREGLWTCDAWSCCSSLCVWSFSFLSLSLSLSSFQRRWQLLMLLSCSGRLWIVLYIAIRKSRDQMRERGNKYCERGWMNEIRLQQQGIQDCENQASLVSILRHTFRFVRYQGVCEISTSNARTHTRRDEDNETSKGEWKKICI